MSIVFNLAELKTLQSIIIEKHREDKAKSDSIEKLTQKLEYFITSATTF